MASSSSSPSMLTKASGEDNEKDGVLCGVCGRQFSRYSCPKCNLAYCSLPCFRSPSHDRCSEAFYRAQIETDIRSEPSKSTQERQRMMELLRKFEEDNLEDDNDESDEEESKDDGLINRLQGLDIDDASYDQLWDALSKEERKKFLNAMQDPSSELAQRLLATSSDIESVRPWWEDDDSIDSNPTNLPMSTISPALATKPRRLGAKPRLMSVPPSLVRSDSSSSFPLAYNLVAIMLAYAFVNRHFLVSPLSGSSFASLQHDMCDLIRSLVPFLFDRKSATRHGTLESVITDVWSRFEPGSISSPVFALILKDTARLLHPRNMNILDPSMPSASLDTSPHLNILLALSDLHCLFSPQDPPGNGSRKAQFPHTAAKIRFYAAQLSSASSNFMDGLSEEIEVRAHREEAEGYLQSYIPDGLATAKPFANKTPARIIEL